MKILDRITLNIPENIGEEFLIKVMGGKLIPKFEALLKEKHGICIDNITPKAIYENYEIEKVVGDSVYFKSGNIFNGPNISKILKGSEIATIFICTLGENIDSIIKQKSTEGDTLATIIMDAITTSMLGCLGDYLGELIRVEGLKNVDWGSTCSYSPGQYRWTIEEQKEIFNMVDGSRIGVVLNKSYLMIPFKSISGVYGFGPIDKIDKTRVACDLCPRVNCIGRR
jgi:hypothetical protein